MKRIEVDFKKNRRGAPSKYKSAEALAEKCNEYFDSFEGRDFLPGIIELCLFLGITRETFSQWRKPGHKLSDVATRAWLIVQSSYEKDLRGKFWNGAAFALQAIDKSWVIRQKHDHKMSDADSEIAAVAKKAGYESSNELVEALAEFLAANGASESGDAATAPELDATAGAADNGT